MKKLRRLHKTAGIVAGVFYTLAVICFFTVYGAIGNFDFAAETHQIMSKAEETQTYWIMALGMVGIILNGSIGMFVSKIKDELADEIAFRRDMLIQKRNNNRERTERAVANYFHKVG